VVVVLSPLPNSKAKYFPMHHHMWSGEDWLWATPFFIIGFLFPFNEMNYLSIVEGFVYRWWSSSKNISLFLNDQKPKPLPTSLPPTTCMIANNWVYLRRNKEHE
jgi:hypothetical protein